MMENRSAVFRWLTIGLSGLSLACMGIVAGCDTFVPPPPGPECSTDADCGDGQECENGQCVTPQPGCVEEGGACDVGAPCCEGLTCSDDGVCEEEPQPAVAYVGTDTCLGCHGEGSTFGDKHNFMLTGHPFKIVPTEGAEPPAYPVTGTLPGPPPGLEWADTAYVIGGFRWKYRVMDTDGFVVLGPTAQYNFPSEEYVAYDNNEDHTAPDGTPGPWEENIGRKPFDCGKCHTTGYDVDTENRRGLEGLVGDWEFDGVHCEECHGPGGNHVASASAADINGAPDSETVCGKCHTRSPDGIAASSGFVKHHEQWDEFSRSVHASAMPNGCTTCHDLHEPIFDQTRLDAIQEAAGGNPRAVDNLDPPPGIIAECTGCHGDVEVNHVFPLECISCHMAFTGKSGQSINANMGDIRGHVWKINDDAEAMMFSDAEGNPVARDSAEVAFAALDGEGQAFITLDFACLRCHTDEVDTLEWAATNAAAIHP